MIRALLTGLHNVLEAQNGKDPNIHIEEKLHIKKPKLLWRCNVSELKKVFILEKWFTVEIL